MKQPVMSQLTVAFDGTETTCVVKTGTIGGAGFAFWAGGQAGQERTKILLPPLRIQSLPTPVHLEEQTQQLQIPNALRRRVRQEEQKDICSKALAQSPLANVSASDCTHASRLSERPQKRETRRPRAPFSHWWP